MCSVHLVDAINLDFQVEARDGFHTKVFHHTRNGHFPPVEYEEIGSVDGGKAQVELGQVVAIY